MSNLVKDEDGRIYDFGTSNTSFLRVCNMLVSLGVKNHRFMLELKNEDLSGVDPFSVSLSTETKLAIMKECKENIFYFLREVVRIPLTDSGPDMRYEADERNLTQALLATNRFDTLVEGKRQTRKTISTCCILLWIFMFQTNEDMKLMSRSTNVTKNILEIIVRLYMHLPLYMNSIGIIDNYKTETQIHSEMNRNKMEVISFPHVEKDPDDETKEELTKKRLDEFCHHITPSVGYYNDFEFIPWCYRVLRETETGFHYASQNIRYGKTYNTEEEKIERVDTGSVYCRLLENTVDPFEPPHVLETKEERMDKLSFERRLIDWDPYYLDLSMEELHCIIDEEVKIGFNGFIRIKRETE